MTKNSGTLSEEKIEKIGNDITGDEKIDVLMKGKLPDRYNHLNPTKDELKKISKSMRDPVESEDMHDLLDF